jgi:HAD superfamily 5'-nucleotidase-like hydrolase
MTRNDQPRSPLPPHERRIFCNRTLNLRSIRAIGYDMDYTLVHYRAEEWELRVYEYARQKLLEQGWPVAELRFDPDLVIRGLIIDTELGNIVKANRFGYVKRAYHGTRPLSFEMQRRVYARIVVGLSDSRYVFLNTLFSLSEACIYAQLVDLLDGGALPGVLGYADLYRRVQSAINEAHVEGRIKGEIIEAPERFVHLDPEAALTLLDQKHAGKKLVLITNSDWLYSRAMMTYTFDRFLPQGMTWRNLFDLVIVSARKPEFFTARSPLFEVVSEDGLLRPARSPQEGGVYLGGSAPLVEEILGLSGDEILYVGDHLYSDVHVTKSILRWRTALILVELESEIAALEGFRQQQQRLSALMAEKVQLEHDYCRLRVELQRRKAGYGPPPAGSEPPESLQSTMDALRSRLFALDRLIAPLARAAGELANVRWGVMMRTGNDKSYLARQVERYADIYLSRVSNLLHPTPFVYFRSHRGSLAHDPGDEVPLPKSRDAGPEISSGGSPTPDLDAEESAVYDGSE